MFTIALWEGKCKEEALESSQVGKISVECVLGEIVNWPGMVFGGYWFVLVVHLQC